MPDSLIKNTSAATPKNAVVLLSGGLDSATVLALALQQNYQVTALSFDYGQRHRFELDAARKIANHHHIQNHLTLKINLDQIGGSALTVESLDVPKNNHESPDQIPITYVPARNTIFLSCALGLAETINAFDIFIGVNALDYSGYPDCRPEFINAFQNLANLATKAGVQSNNPQDKFRIQAPLINLTKAQIITQGTALAVPYQLTHSCYDPQPNTGQACGSCDACILRKRRFQEAKIPDPTPYIKTVNA